MTTKTVSLILAASILSASCSSTTMIQSSPSGAKVYVDGQPVGIAPYTHQDTKIVGSTTHVKLEKEGYEPLQTSFSRSEQVDVGAVIGGLFVWVPFLWVMKYNPMHTYELTPVSSNQTSTSKPALTANPTSGKSKAERLRELKQLLDDKIITQTEFDTEKRKILEEK